MRTTAAFAILALGALAGCQQQFTCDVRNNGDQPITAQLVWANNAMTREDLRSARLGPGDRGSIGPVWTDKPVKLVIDFQGNTGYPGELPLTPGLNVVNVRRADEGSQGTLKLERVTKD